MHVALHESESWNESIRVVLRRRFGALKKLSRDGGTPAMGENDRLQQEPDERSSGSSLYARSVTP